jgi:hypothetical protein
LSGEPPGQIFAQQAFLPLHRDFFWLDIAGLPQGSLLAELSATPIVPGSRFTSPLSQSKTESGVYETSFLRGQARQSPGICLEYF